MLLRHRCKYRPGRFLHSGERYGTAHAEILPCGRAGRQHHQRRETTARDTADAFAPASRAGKGARAAALHSWARRHHAHRTWRDARQLRRVDHRPRRESRSRHIAPSKDGIRQRAHRRRRDESDAHAHQSDDPRARAIPRHRLPNVQRHHRRPHGWPRTRAI